MIARVIVGLLEVATVLGCVVGSLFIFDALQSSVSAVQGAELAVIGLGFAIIPYCLAGVGHRNIMRSSAPRSTRGLAED